MSVEQGEAAEKRRVDALRPHLVYGGWFIVAVAGAAYLWAVIFGDGMSGLTDGATLGQRPNSDLPNANVSLIAALGAYVASPMFAWWASPTGRFSFRKWLLASAVVGAVVFAISRLFV